HAIVDSLLAALLNYRSIGNGIGKRNTDFNQVNTGLLQMQGNGSGIVQCRKAGCKKYRQDILFLFTEKFFNTVHSFSVFHSFSLRPEWQKAIRFVWEAADKWRTR